jgi:hypothetical protein
LREQSIEVDEINRRVGASGLFEIAVMHGDHDHGRMLRVASALRQGEAEFGDADRKRDEWQCGCHSLRIRPAGGDIVEVEFLESLRRCAIERVERRDETGNGSSNKLRDDLTANVDLVVLVDFGESHKFTRLEVLPGAQITMAIAVLRNFDDAGHLAIDDMSYLRSLERFTFPTTIAERDDGNRQFSVMLREALNNARFERVITIERWIIEAEGDSNHGENVARGFLPLTSTRPHQTGSWRTPPLIAMVVFPEMVR